MGDTRIGHESCSHVMCSRPTRRLLWMLSRRKSLLVDLGLGGLGVVDRNGDGLWLGLVLDRHRHFENT